MEKTLNQQVAFSGRALTLDVLSVALEDGRVSQREVIRHPGAVVILAQRPDERFVFVRQYRKAVETLLLETVAGTLDPGETVEACACRELQEETGYIAESLTSLGQIAPAPGYSSEILYLFYADVPMEAGAMSPDDDERIEVVHFTQDEIEQAIDDGALWDAKTLAAWLLFSRYKRK